MFIEDNKNSQTGKKRYWICKQSDPHYFESAQCSRYCVDERCHVKLGDAWLAVGRRKGNERTIDEPYRERNVNAKQNIWFVGDWMPHEDEIFLGVLFTLKWKRPRKILPHKKCVYNGKRVWECHTIELFLCLVCLIAAFNSLWDICEKIQCRHCISIPAFSNTHKVNDYICIRFHIKSHCEIAHTISPV